MIAASQALFGRGSLDELSPATLRAALAEAGLVARRRSCPTWPGCSRSPGLVASMKEARRVIAEGGAYVNNERITDVDATVDAGGPAARSVPGAAPRASARSPALSWGNSRPVDDVTRDAPGGFDDQSAGRVTFSLPARNGRNRRKT